MKQTEPLPDPPFLQAVYLREDFDLKRSGSAFQKEDVAEGFEEEAAAVEDEAGFGSTSMMDDDEFLQSLMSPEPSFEDSSSDESPVESQADAELFGADSNLESDDVPRGERFPFSIPWVSSDFSLSFPNAVTFFVGENGSGKSTLIEAIAVQCGYPISGGGASDATSLFGPEKNSELAQAMFPHFKKRHRDGYFFRAEFYAHFASLLEQRAVDPEFDGDPYMRYGGKSLHQRSHGESFLALLQNRLNTGMFLLDEPESALSPQRQLTLLAMIADRVAKGKSQFIIATHSPILLTYPGATIISFDGDELKPVTIEQTEHYQLTKGILEHPDKYWSHLLKDAGKRS